MIVIKLTANSFLLISLLNHDLLDEQRSISCHNPQWRSFRSADPISPWKSFWKLIVICQWQDHKIKGLRWLSSAEVKSVFSVFFVHVLDIDWVQHSFWIPLTKLDGEKTGEIVLLCSTEKINAYGLATSVLEGRCPAEFSTNPNQTPNLKKLINVFKITRKLQAGVWLGLELNSAGLWGCG